MSGAGKNKLIAYIHRIQSKLKSIEDSGEEPDDLSSIVANVVTSIRSLCGGAPEETRGAIKSALGDHGCLEGACPNPAAGLSELSAGLQAVAEVLGIADGGGDDGQAEQEQPPPTRWGAPMHTAEAPRHQVNTDPGDEAELLTGVVDRLWDIEQPYRFVLGKDLHLNVQSRADAEVLTARGLSDRASEPLFKDVNRAKFSRLDQSFLRLLDNYERELGKKERVTAQEKSEMDLFLDLLDDSPHMQYVHKVLVKWGSAPAKMRDWMAQVYDAWFGLYYGGTSSGFEHVFVGEEKFDKTTGRSEIVGLHNWMQFYREEQKGNMNYLGYAGRANSDDHVISVKFAWADDDPDIEVKTLSTFLVGTSIAFEFALASLAFFAGKDGEAPWVKIGGCDCQIQIFKQSTSMGEKVRSVFLK